MSAVDGTGRLSSSRQRGLARAFAYFDQDGNTVLDPVEIKRILVEMGMSATDDEVGEILVHMDKNKDGKIDGHEFGRASDRSLAKMGIEASMLQSPSAPAQAPPALGPQPHAAGIPNGIPKGGFQPPMRAADGSALQRLFVDLCARALQLTEAFAASESSHQGSVMWNDFVAGIQHMGLPVADAEVQQLVNQFGDPGSGRVSYEEFLGAVFQAGAHLVREHGARSKAPPPQSAAPIGTSAASPQAQVPTISPQRLKEIMTLMQQKVLQKHRSLQQAFRSMDSDKSGYVTAQEFAALFHTFGISLTFVELQAVVQMYDPNNDGKVSYLEFCQKCEVEGGGAIMPDDNRNAQPLGSSISEIQEYADLRGALKALQENLSRKHSTVREMFLKLDKDRSGAIAVDEFQTALESMPILIDDEVLYQVVRYFDRNGDGQVKYDEFLATFQC